MALLAEYYIQFVLEMVSHTPDIGSIQAILVHQHTLPVQQPHKLLLQQPIFPLINSDLTNLYTSSSILVLSQSSRWVFIPALSKPMILDQPPQLFPHYPAALSESD